MNNKLKLALLTALLSLSAHAAYQPIPNPLPVTGTITTTPPSDATTNVTKVGGTAVDANSGNKSAGTLRVVLATDQPTLTNPFAVTGTFWQATQPVSGTFWQATQPVSGTFWQATQPVSGTVGVSGTVSVTGTFFQATQPVSAASLPLPSGASTSAKQPALGTAGTASADVLSVQGIAGMTAVKVDGSAVTQPVSGTVAVSGTVPVSGTIAATQSGTWTVQPGNTANTTAWKVDGSAVTQPVSGTFWQATQPVSGTVTANAGSGTFAVSAASLPLPSGAATDASVTGLQVAQASTTSGQSGPLAQTATTTAAPTYVTAKTNPLSTTTTGALRVDIGATSANATAIKVDGSAVTQPVSLSSTTITGTVAATQSGTWTVQPGNTANTTAWKVDGSAVTQPVSGTVTSNQGTAAATTSAWPVLVTDTSNTAVKPGDATNNAVRVNIVAGASSGAVAQGSTTSGQTGGLMQGAVTTAAPTYTTAQTDPLSLTTTGALRVDNSANTQPVSGTVTANIGTSGSLALDATLTGGTQQTKITDGTNVATVKAASTAAGATDKAVVVAVSPNNSVAVTGTFWQATQPVSGTVTANIGTSGSLALDATLTGGTQQTKITDGTNVATVKAASTAAGATDKAVVVAVSPNNSVAVTGTFWQATQPVSGTVTTTPPSNASTNVAQVAGTAADTNSGAKSAGTLRVVLATDQPALTNKLLVTPDSVALPANQSVNVSQINAVTPLMGNGTTGTGSQRVTIASDNTAFSVNATPQASTTGGWTMYTGSLTNTAVAVDASAGQVGGYYFYNSNATVCYIQFWNTAQGSVTVGTTAPVLSIGIPATGGANLNILPGLPFTTAITIAATTTRSNGTACVSNIDANVFYK